MYYGKENTYTVPRVHTNGPAELTTQLLIDIYVAKILKGKKNKEKEKKKRKKETKRKRKKYRIYLTIIQFVFCYLKSKLQQTNKTTIHIYRLFSNTKPTLVIHRQSGDSRIIIMAYSIHEKCYITAILGFPENKGKPQKRTNIFYG